MERRKILRILETSNELIAIAKSIARGSEPTIMFRPLGRNIEFGCQPSRPRENAGTHPNSIIAFEKQ